MSSANDTSATPSPDASSPTQRSLTARTDRSGLSHPGRPRRRPGEGFALPPIGVAAAVCLIVYFLGASATAIRAHSYGTSVFPLLYLIPAAATLALQLAR
ncbi:DoxX family protein [Nocardia puris]|uniref:DoxX family protein n=1 Tax=Nocardia puris TaxID=208602 RepID=UPI00082C79B8|nr:DoxX family protein [Nocardia puris]MBF6212832.1 DoxX family protein [Nocardia puris]MBF6367767.1 DoxX family protein [Nocardia puris]MBF6461418.1 DoxX family protein [Nocardia puris]